MKFADIPCGCVLRYLPETDELIIDWCPLHAAAPLMKAALEEASRRFYNDMAPDFNYYSENMFEAHKVINAAIAAAEIKRDQNQDQGE